MSECKVCKQAFVKNGKNQKICSQFCREKNKIIQSNKKWLDRKEKESDPVRNLKIEQSRLYNQNGWILSKFKACRG